jgi:ribosomal protein S18 acetylase RimI-like enzyme
MTSVDVDAVRAASRLFDSEARPDWTRRFLEEANHHLCIAYDGGEPAGFVSGVELTHPDKGTEMLLYELGVDDRFRRRGIGRALVAALADLARERGCHGMWVLTEAENEAAVATYESAGAGEKTVQLMLAWQITS